MRLFDEKYVPLRPNKKKAMNKRRRKRNKRNNRSRLWLWLLVVMALLVGVAYYFGFTAMSKTGEATYLYIDNDDDMDSVTTKLQPIATRHALWTFKKLAAWKHYANHIRTGRYLIDEEGAVQTFRHIRNGIQAPVSLSLGSVRTKQRLAQQIGRRLMLSSDELLQALNDSALCASYGYTPQTIIAMFIPNTYDLYWNIALQKFLDRMHSESEKFWTLERKDKAREAGLSQVEVMTLASIVDEETANVGEMPKVAGMYLNRLNIGMLLQADPTVKYANNNFEARRIYNSMLRVDSPYNTYRYKGLPPGPIRIPSLQSVEAVLNYDHHDYLYMCAKEDFSGTHNFAKTYAEHMQNAARYAKALNERGVK